MSGRLWTYLLSAALVIGLTAIKLTVPALDRMPFLLYLAAVVVAAWHGGRGPAALVIVLSSLAGQYLFTEPRFAIELDRHALTQSIVFVLEAIAITELIGVLKRARAEARDAATRLATTLRSIGDAVIATDSAGRITFMNTVAEALTGWTATDAQGRALEDVFVVVDDQTRLRLESPVREMLRRGQIADIDHHALLLSSRGAETPIEETGAPIRDPSGRSLGVVLVFRNVSEAKKHAAEREVLANATAALAASLDYRTTLARVADLIVPSLADWCAIEMVDERSGKSEQLAVSHSDPGKVSTAWELRRRFPPSPERPGGIQRVLRTGQPELHSEVTDEILDAVATSPEHRAMLRALALRSAMLVPLVARGRTLGVITMVHAESGRRYGPDDVAFTQQLAERAAIAVDNALLFTREREARETADHATQLKDEFLVTLSHELRTPLTTIVGWSRLLAEGAIEEPKRARAIATIERNATNMTQLVDDLLDVSRLLAGNLRIEARELSLGSVVDTAIEAIRPAAHAKELALVSDLEADAPIYGDPLRLQQVIWNLLSNAVKFTPRGGRVGVELSRHDAVVELKVSDSGRGITSDFLPFVFDRFRRADASFSRGVGGLGLGLAIARHLVELHGGSIRVASRGAGLGASFVVCLPVARTSSSAFERRRSLLPFVANHRLEGARVLLVEDDEPTRDLVATLLDTCGCEVRATSDVEKAMRAFDEQVPDVVVSDFGMPAEDGLELIRRIRRRTSEQGGDVPAAALTGHARPDDRERALGAGYSMHVAKPVDPAELVSAVESLLRERQHGGLRTAAAPAP